MTRDELITKYPALQGLTDSELRAKVAEMQAAAKARRKLLEDKVRALGGSSSDRMPKRAPKKPVPSKPQRRAVNCPICDKPLVGRQRTACSNKCTVALHRRNKKVKAERAAAGGSGGPVSDVKATCKSSIGNV